MVYNCVVNWSYMVNWTTMVNKCCRVMYRSLMVDRGGVVHGGPPLQPEMKAQLNVHKIITYTIA